ncbi:signal transduction histidine kinase/ActR/RegA family two-component response regulator [Brevundimonas vesicularis]|uniref:histidine kinase n=1 Tax=Brevundimonas vesicularis TaxID=41276 RepID=A0A7W9FTX0_BREVE|nr:ATP-binding protein [Brevundimonas vesicularis]MBB5771529.1 signal transduction histidine kinase/ActR/RegA family two-component response regulator [Brevundimonas vesicularis]
MATLTLRRSSSTVLARLDEFLARYGALLLTFGVILAAVIGGACLLTIESSIRADKRSAEIGRAAANSMAAAFHQQTKLRHFALTGDDTVRQEAERRQKVFEARAEKLLALTRHDPAQTARVTAMIEAVDFARAAVLAAANTPHPAGLFIGDADMTGVRELGEAIEQAESQEAAARRQRDMRILGWLRIALFSGAAPTVLLSGLYALRSWRGLIRSEREARRLADAKSKALAVASHEIRTPLNGILGMAEAMARHPLDKDQQARLDVLRESGEVLIALLNDLLDASKIEAGRLDLVVEPFELDAVLRRIQSNFSAVAQAKSVSLEVVVHPDCATNWSGDALRIGQILSNLVSNALKFTDAGVVSITASETDAGRLRLEVRDTGPGMSPEIVSRLFRPFQQASATTSHDYGGTGLGLSIAQSLAGLMDCKIRVESTSGVGSLFSLELPLAKTNGPAKSTRLTTTVPKDSSVSDLRLLAADDNPANRQVLATVLSSLGVQAHIAASGAEAVKAFKTGSFDGVLLDLRMPGLDGFQTAAEIRSYEASLQRPQCPLALFSGDISEETRRVAQGLGFVAFIAKPLRISDLTAALSTIKSAQPEVGATSAPNGCAPMDVPAFQTCEAV